MKFIHFAKLDNKGSRCVLLEQSEAMFQPGRLSHWCLSLFVYFLVYRFTVPLLLYGAQAQTVPLKSETQNALETISNFLRNEAGAKWFAALAQSQRKAAITTDELMEAVLGATEENGTVWRAAATLRSALAAQAHHETIPIPKHDTTSSLEPVIDYWSDVISDMEKHDDIICLYRKDTEAKMKKSSDWQKLLKNLSPGYTVHLALDRGSKYVICLKKVNVPTTQTPQTTPPTTLITSVQDISSTTPILTQITQSSGNEESSATTVEASTQPSVPENTATSPATQTTQATQAIKSLIENTTPASIQENLNSVKHNEGNVSKHDGVKNSEDRISGSLAMEARDELKPEILDPLSPLIVKLARAQDVENPGELDDKVMASSECDCSEESDRPQIIERPRPIAMPCDEGSQNSLASESRSPDIGSVDCSPCRIPYMPRPYPQENMPNPFGQNIGRNLDVKIPTPNISAPFSKNAKNIPIWFNSAESNKREIEPCNKDFEYSSQIPSRSFIPLQKNLELQSWLLKLLLKNYNSANKSPLAYPLMMPSYQMNSDCSKVLPPRFGKQDIGKPLISNGKVPPLRVNPTISSHGPLSNAPLSSVPSFLLRQPNHRVPSSIEFLGARENPFSLKPIVPQHQTGYFPQLLMEQNSIFPKNSLPQVKPLASPQINPKSTISQPIGIPRFEPCGQNPSIPVYQKKNWTPNSPTFLPFNEPMISSAFELPVIPPNIFPNENPSVHRTPLPQIPLSNKDCNQLPSLPTRSGFIENFAPRIPIGKKLPLKGLDKDPTAPGPHLANSLSPIPLVQYPHAPHNTRFSPNIPIRNSGYSSSDIQSLMLKSRVPKLLNMTNKNSIERNMPSIGYSVPPTSRGVTRLIRKEVGNAVNFSDYIRTMLPVLVPKNLFNPWRIPGKQKSNDADSYILHNRACSNSCKKTIPLKIKVHGSTADSFRIKVIPGKGEKVKIIDKKKGLFNVQQNEESDLLDEVFDSRRNAVKKSSEKSAKDDDAKSLESRVDETADEIEKHMHHKNLTEDKSLPAIPASSFVDRDTETLEKSSTTIEETTKSDPTPQIIDTTESTRSVNNTSTVLHDTSENPFKSESQ